MIRLSGLVKSVSTGSVDVEILRDIDLHVQEGELLGIVGPSGSGKSTLLNIVGLLDRPTSGRYELDGGDVSGLSDRELDGLRSQVFGFVFQAFHLLEGRTVADNVEIGLVHSGVPRRERHRLVADAISAVGLTARAGFAARTLSGGEKQRVAIARALAGSKRVILCDEPTGNLDSMSSAAIIDLLVRLHDIGRTIVIVTHDQQVVVRCSRVVEMHDGRIRDEPLSLRA
jgi:putative ABC transport system ATP-binding protein